MTELREGSYQNKGYRQTMIIDVITNTLARQNVQQRISQTHSGKGFFFPCRQSPDGKAYPR